MEESMPCSEQVQGSWCTSIKIGGILQGEEEQFIKGKMPCSSPGKHKTQL